MPTFSPGTRIRMANGTTVTVVDLLGAGGQGEVYKVRASSGVELALKWYTAPALITSNNFYGGMKVRSEYMTPSPVFLWPVLLTVRARNGAFGYLMRLRPPQYIEMGDYFCIDRNPDAWLRSYMAKINAGLTVADSFSRMHLEGLCFQDINDGNFFLDPMTGDVLICDTDNIVPDGRGGGISGKPRYMAPEVLAGQRPTCLSDRFSVAIILYRIFMIDHPFEGRLTMDAANSLLTTDRESELFGADAVFCYDRRDDRNRPDPELQPNSAAFWPQMPAALREAFEMSFSHEALVNPSLRVSSTKWREIMASLRAKVITCPAGRGEDAHDFIIDEQVPRTCPVCGAPIGPVPYLVFPGGERYYLTPGKKLYFEGGFRSVGQCVSMNTRNRGRILGLENLTNEAWHYSYPGDYPCETEPGSSIIFSDGIEIDFGGTKATLHVPR